MADPAEMEGSALKYEGVVDLSIRNNAHTQMILLAGRDADVLEVGPARGYMTEALAARGCRVTGVELDPVAAKEAERHAARMIVGDVERLDFANAFGDERFDAVIYGDVLEHLVHPERTLWETARVLKPGGHVVASIPNVAHASVRLALLGGSFEYTDVGLLDETHLRFFTKGTIQNLFEAAGFEIVSWRRVTLDPFDTELSLREEDYPKELVKRLRQDQDALTYQYVIKARTLPAGSVKALRAPWLMRRRRSEPIRGAWPEIEALQEEIQSREARIRWLSHRLEQQGELVRGERVARSAMHRELAEARRGLAWAKGELDILLGSSAHRALEGILRRLRRWFPLGTRRGGMYRRFGRAIAWLMPRGRGRGRRQQATGPVTSESYARWIERSEPSGEEVERTRDEANWPAYRPTISIVMPVWNSPLHTLREALASVQGQTYGNWELCIADGGSREEVRRMLREFASRESRVRLALLDGNGGISTNSNAALALATGAYVAFLDHTDVLAPFALHEIVRVIDRDPGLDVVHSDHDLLSASGDVRADPLLTPAWSPELLLSANYMAHLAVIRRDLVEDVGRLRPELDGAQDWDLLLRVTERTGRIARVPKVLYHWRADETSAAFSLDTKPYALAAQERAVREALERRGLQGEVVREGKAIRIRWQLTDHPLVTIVIPTKHNRELLTKCLDAIWRSTYREFEIVVVETAGLTEERADWYGTIQRDKLRVLWWDKPFNYSQVNDFAVRDAAGDVLVFLNDDTEPLAPDWLEEIIGWVTQPEIGVVGAQLVDPDGRIQHGGVAVGLGGFADHLFKGAEEDSWSAIGPPTWYRNVSAVTGACLAMRREVYDAVGGWDDRFILCGSDVELCLRAGRAGYRTMISPFARLLHHEGATRGSYVPPEDFATSFWHYQALLFGGDPYFHPGLSKFELIPSLQRDDEPDPLQVVSDVLDRDVTPRGPSDPSAEARVFAEAFQATEADVESVLALHAETRGRSDVTSINWFVPDFENPFYGGIHTIFRMADQFQFRFGVKSRFVVMGSGPEPLFRSGLRVAFPSLAEAEVYVCPGATPEQLAEVPFADVSIATLWVTAYAMLRFGATRRKFYLVQDYEPIFYPAGTVQALAEQTYRMGYYGIANTPTLERIYRDQYGGRAVGFMPAVDPIFSPRGESRDPAEPFTVFFYGRPGHPRNSWELAMAALRRLKDDLKDRVRIVTAGSWAPAEGDEAPFLERLGLLGYEDTAELYRNCDAGLVLSVSRHPSYLPMQLMASGCMVVSNLNPAGDWLLRSGENCLLAPPTGQALADALRRGLLDDELRSKLTSRASADIETGFRDWATELDRVYAFICDPEG